jgi:D-sedoheptulose 7-phosphate isomerase
MSAERFELIFEGMREDSGSTRLRLMELLSSQRISQIFEIDSLLDGGPFLIQHSQNKEDLEASYQKLKEAGAQVLIVRSRERRNQESKRRRAKLELVVSDGNALVHPAAPKPRIGDSLLFRQFFAKYSEDVSRILRSMDISEVEQLAEDFLEARDKQNQIFVFGNGGSASSASHMATDFSKQRFDDESKLFRITSLNDNSSFMTATANDFGYEFVFEKQLKTLLRPNDLVIGISSSGNSPNITRAIEFANGKGAKTWGIVGFNGGALKKCAQKSVYIPTKVGQYGYMEDITLIINHMISIYIYEQDCS